MKKTEPARNMDESNLAPPVHAKCSVPKPVNAEKTVNERQFSAHTRDSKRPMKPTRTAKSAVRDDGKDLMKTDDEACIQSSTTQPEAISTTTEPLRTITVGQRQFLLANGDNPTGAIDVLQFRRMPRQQLPSQEPNTASNTRKDYYIGSNVPKKKLSDFSGDPLERPEWSQLCQATIHSANMGDMNSLKTRVTGKAKEAIAGPGNTTEM